MCHIINRSETVRNHKKAKPLKILKIFEAIPPTNGDHFQTVAMARPRQGRWHCGLSCGKTSRSKISIKSKQPCDELGATGGIKFMTDSGGRIGRII